MVGIARAALCWSTNWARGGRDPNSHRPVVVWSLLLFDHCYHLHHLMIMMNSTNIFETIYSKTVVWHNFCKNLFTIPDNALHCETSKGFHGVKLSVGKWKRRQNAFQSIPFLGKSWQTKAFRDQERVTFFADGAAIKEGEIQYVAFLTFQILNFHAIFLFQSCISLYVNLSHLCGFVCPPLIFLYFVFLLPLEGWSGPRLVKWSLSPADYHNSNPFIWMSIGFLHLPWSIPWVWGKAVKVRVAAIQGSATTIKAPQQRWQ